MRFARPMGQRPLPVPERSGGLDRLWALLNLSEDGVTLVRAYLQAVLRPEIPVPVLVLLGPQGSGKSTAAEILRSLADPSVVPLQAPPRSERDLVIAARRCRVVALDNLSEIRPWLSDALCRLATGGGFAARKLHTDADEVLVRVQRPVLLTGITDLIERHDLADRAIVLRLEPLEGKRRAEQHGLMQRFDESWPGILGALLDDVARGHRRLVEARDALDRLPRMADFAIWSTAASSDEAAISDQVINAFESNRQEADLELEGGDVVAAVFLDWARSLHERWEGRPLELYGLLKARLPPGVRSGWPGAPNALTSRLRRAEEHIRAAGVAVELGASRGSGAAKHRVIIVAPPPTPIVHEPYADDADDADGLRWEDFPDVDY